VQTESVKDLARKIMRYIRKYAKAAKPFRWKYFRRDQAYQAMLTEPNDGVIFPKRRPDGSFCVEVTLAANTNDEDLGGRIRQWLTEVWMPSNTAWLRVWKTGPGLSVERPELLHYGDEFLSPPILISSVAAEVRFQLRGRDPKQKLWRDWLVLRILPDLKANFPEVGDTLSITNCE